MTGGEKVNQHDENAGKNDFLKNLKKKKIFIAIILPVLHILQSGINEMIVALIIWTAFEYMQQTL